MNKNCKLVDRSYSESQLKSVWSITTQHLDVAMLCWGWLLEDFAATYGCGQCIRKRIKDCFCQEGKQGN